MVWDLGVGAFYFFWSSFQDPLLERTIDSKILLLSNQYKLCNAFCSDCLTLTFHLQIMQLFPLLAIIFCFILCVLQILSDSRCQTGKLQINQKEILSINFLFSTDSWFSWGTDTRRPNIFCVSCKLKLIFLYTTFGHVVDPLHPDLPFQAAVCSLCKTILKLLVISCLGYNHCTIAHLECSSFCDQMKYLTYSI